MPAFRRACSRSAKCREPGTRTVTTELVLLGTAGAPAPVAGRAGISSALIVDGRVFVIDCGRGSPSAFADAGLDFARLEAVLITHVHADHTGDLPGMLIYPWGLRAGDDGPLPPIRVYGPPRPTALPDGDASFHRQTTINPDLPDPGSADLVKAILDAYAYHLNIMPLDARMPDPAELVRAIDVTLPGMSHGAPQVPVILFEDEGVRVSSVAVMHGRAVPALAYRFDTADGSVGVCRRHDGQRRSDRPRPGRRHSRSQRRRPRLPLPTRLLRCRSRTNGRAPHRCEPDRERRRAGTRTRAGPHPLRAPEPDAITAAEWAERARHGFGGKTTAGQDGLRRILSG